MRNIVPLVLAALALVPLAATGADTGWKDSSGKPIEDTDSQKSRDGFGGMVLVTPDQDWEAKWNTPAEVKPQFNAASTVERGQKLFVLIFFVNPKVQDGAADVTCHLKVTRPNGTTSLNQASVPCHQGPIRGDAFHVRLAGPVIGFVGEPNDPAGRWVVAVTLYDNLRGTELPLRTSFVLK